MPPERERDLQLEIGHVLFIDIVGSSKLLINEQREVLYELNDLVRGTKQVCAADSADKLIRLPTGEGMALVFRDSPEGASREGLGDCAGVEESSRRAGADGHSQR